MNTANRILILILFFIAGWALGCSRSLQVSNITTLLTNDSVKYWNSTWKIPFFREDYKEGGLAFYSDGKLVEYQTNELNQRIIINVGTSDIFCSPTTYEIEKDTLVINSCGYTFRFKIENLTHDKLKLKEIPPYGFFPDLGTEPGSIPKIFTVSSDQKNRPINDWQDYSHGPVKVIFK